mgnify:FL=1|jgi:hypothetical protein
MSLKKTNFLIFISFFPVFIFRSNLSINEIIITIFFFIVPALLINTLLIRKEILKNFFLRLYLSIIIIYGIDNHLGLWNGLILPFKHDIIDFFGIIYVPGIILFFSLSLLTSYFILIGKEKFYNVILVFLFTIFIFGIFDQTKSFSGVNSFKKNVNKKYNETDVVIVFDEMAGINSFESFNDTTSTVIPYIKKFFKKYNFQFYNDVESLSRNTAASMSALLNFSEDTTIRERVLNKSPNYFTEYELTKNVFFNKYKDVSIYQNTHIDLCNFKNISKCESYNPFLKKLYLKGFKDTYFTKIISIWKLNGSISSILVWRSLRQLRLIDSILEPEGHKISFPNLFKSLEVDIISKKYDLIFVHTLVPHRPYGFDTKCNYDGSLSLTNRYFSVTKMVKQHNIERKCTFFYLDNFLKKLKKINLIDSVNLTILSDHGSRIKRTKDSDLPSIFAFRNKKTIYKEIKEKKILHNLFIEHFK